MNIPEELQEVIARIFLELKETEQIAIKGLNLIRPLIAKFQENRLLTSLFVSLNNTLLFVEISKRRIRLTVNRISQLDTTIELEEVGEDLGTELGKTLETKIEIEAVVKRLEKLL